MKGDLLWEENGTIYEDLIFLISALKLGSKILKVD